MKRMREVIRRHGYVVAIAAIALATAVFYPGRDVFAKGQWALLYLLIVVVVASVSGVGPALLAAGLSFLAWNFFFLPPYHTLTVNDPKDWLSLLAFLAVGSLMGLQTGRMRARELRAVARERETAFLNRISSSLVSEPSPKEMAETVVAETVALLGVEAAALYERRHGELSLLAGRSSDDADVRRWARLVAEQGLPLGLPRSKEEVRLASDDPVGASLPPRDGSLVFLPLQTATTVHGVLYARTGTSRDTLSASEVQLLGSLANLVAAFLEQQGLEEAATRATALREADRLKSSLLSSVSHELKTPLAGLTATLSNLLEGDVDWDEEKVKVELRAIVADVQRLTNSINALLDLSRLEADSWRPQKDWYEVTELAVAALATLPPHQRARVEIAVADDLPLVPVDFVQLTRVLQSLLENAILYTEETCPIRLGAAGSAQAVEIWVEDEGGGVPADERGRIFEKFYRGASLGATAPSGTGLGLAIAAEIVGAHGGAIRYEPVMPHGSRFVVTLGRVA